MEFIQELNDVGVLTNILKLITICIMAYYTSLKIMKKQNEVKYKLVWIVLALIFVSIICVIIEYLTNFIVYLVSLILFLTLILAHSTQNSKSYSLIITTISLSINYIIFISATVISFMPMVLFRCENIYIGLCIISILYIMMVRHFIEIKKFKQGFSFLQKNKENESLIILILNISTIILMGVIIISDYSRGFSRRFMFALLALAVVMFITIQKSLQLYYKQKLLVQELENTKKELAEKTKEIENLEAENIAISKKAHTLDHKQKSLAKKIDEMIMNTEISKEKVAEVKGRLNKIGQDLYKEKIAVELSKTEIPEIDDMLSYMQSECSANKIDFELQIKGNIHYMTNNLITIEDLETLLADHIKNAIIAINHTDNVNRSILVRVGKIDGIYSLYIYDSGIEFSKETLENLGKKPSTTHADEGGTGMGFMNTFDTLRKCKASLTIEELNEPCKDNYTKAIIIKFDNKNEFKIIHKEC